MLILKVFVEWTNTLHPMYDTHSPAFAPAYASNGSTNSYPAAPPTLSPGMVSESRKVELPFQILHTSEHDMVGVFEFLRPPLV